MNKLNVLINISTNIGIYLIYISIASLSIVISYKVSVILSIMVIPIELLRLIAIQKKMHKFIAAVIVLNLGLIGYSSHKLEVVTKDNNQVIQTNNTSINKYINSVWLKSNTFDKKLDKTQFKQVDVSYLVITIGYALFEVLMFCFIRELNNQDKKEQKKLIKPIKKLKVEPKQLKIEKIVKEDKQELNTEKLDDNWVYVGSYIDYAKVINKSVRQTKELFKQAQLDGRFKKQDGKNYLRS